MPIEVPVVILGNKTDKPGCYGRVELLETLEIQEDVQRVSHLITFSLIHVHEKVSIPVV